MLYYIEQDQEREEQEMEADDKGWDGEERELEEQQDGEEGQEWDGEGWVQYSILYTVQYSKQGNHGEKKG